MHEILRAIGAGSETLPGRPEREYGQQPRLGEEGDPGRARLRAPPGRSTAFDCPRTDAAQPALELSGLARARTNWRSLSPRVRIAYRPPSIARHYPRGVTGIDADWPPNGPTTVRRRHR